MDCRGTCQQRSVLFLLRVLFPRNDLLVPSDSTFDPAAAAKDDRKARKLKNESQRLKNLQRAAANASTSVQTTASRLAERESRKVVIDRELKVTKKSTASMGRFDEKIKGEAKEKNIKRKVRSFLIFFNPHSFQEAHHVLSDFIKITQFDANEVAADSERSKSMSILTKIGATPSNKRIKVSDDHPDAGKSDGLVNSRVAIRKLTGGRGALSLEGKKGGKGKGFSKNKGKISGGKGKGK